MQRFALDHIKHIPNKEKITSMMYSAGEKLILRPSDFIVD
jgi:hypothetical protein